MMESKVSINLSKQGQHYFRVERVGYQANSREVVSLTRELRKRFPECEVNVTEWKAIGREVTILDN